MTVPADRLRYWNASRAARAVDAARYRAKHALEEVDYILAEYPDPSVAGHSCVALVMDADEMWVTAVEHLLHAVSVQ